MAARYFLNIGANWGDTANWSDTSGGAGGFSVPTSSDDVFFDNNSGNCTVNASNRACLSINFTNYSNNINFAFNITSSGNITLSASMTFSGSGTLICNATATLTSNGKAINIPLTLTGSTVTFTLADNWTTQALLTLNGSTTTNIINGNNIYIEGNLTHGSGRVEGTTNIIFQGTTTWTNSAGNELRNNVTFNTSGTITLSGNIRYAGGTMTWSSGTIVSTGATVSFQSFSSGINTTIDLNGLILDNVLLAGASLTHTINSPFSVRVLLTIGGTNNSYVINGNRINVLGSMSVQNGFVTTGSTDIYILGTGTISSTGLSSLALNIYIEANGIVTFGNTFCHGGTAGKVLEYRRGIIRTQRTNLSLFVCTLINIHHILFNSVTIIGAITITMDKFFSGSPYFPCRVRNSIAGTRYSIALTSGIQELAFYVMVSDCQVTTGTLLICTTNGNKGNNIGVEYINQLPNGFAQNQPNVKTTQMFPGLMSDPSVVRTIN